MEIVRDLVPAGARKVIYALYIVGGIAVGVAGIAAPGPWTQVATDILAYLAVPMAVLAGTNVNGAPVIDTDPTGKLTDN